MATTTFNTRISLKYDTYAQWVEKDPQLLVGEVAVVVVPAETGAVAKEPAVLFKVGDGAHKFSELQFTAGLAADVYDWAKAASKPTYSANEIDGLSDYISGEIQDTDTQYKLEVDADNSRKFHLYSQAKGTSTWNLVSTITIPDETVYTLAEGTANGTVKFNGEDVKVHGLGTAAYKDEGAFDAAGAATKALEDAKTYKKEHFLFGEGYEHFYFLTNDYHGETLLWLLCHPEIIGQLNAMLLQELQPPCRNAFIENDARTDAGAPILFCYLPDLPRLFRFLSALELLQMKGAILCFDFQADALQALCGDKVELQTIDFAAFERRFLTLP